MIDRQAEIPITRQCELLVLPRSTAYFEPQPESEENVALMRLIDKVHLDEPWLGARGIKRQLKRLHGLVVSRKRVKRLMQLMGIRSMAPQPQTSVRRKDHPIYPYLLGNIEITHANQVWAADITYIPMPRGHLYLVAIIDWYSRKVLSWRLSITLEADFCVAALHEAMVKYGKPEIFNTDQGVQFTSADFVDALKDADIRISMDGKGCWLDNVFVERLWRSLKYEEVYRYAYKTVSEATARLSFYFQYFNQRRGHSSLNDQTPDEVYYTDMQNKEAA